MLDWYKVRAKYNANNISSSWKILKGIETCRNRHIGDYSTQSWRCTNATKRRVVAACNHMICGPICTNGVHWADICETSCMKTYTPKFSAHWRHPCLLWHTAAAPKYLPICVFLWCRAQTKKLCRILPTHSCFIGDVLFPYEQTITPSYTSCSV